MKEIVKAGYNKIAQKYQEQRGIFDNSKELEEFAAYFKKGNKILDLGCGAGVPVVRFLVDKGFEVIGIDFSESMLKLARKNVPVAKFIKMDMANLDFPENTFDGATAFYSIIHFPRDLQPVLFKRLHRIMKPGAVILLCLGYNELEETSDDYMGVKMAWSQWSGEKALQLIKKAGFSIISNKRLTIGEEDHYWVTARCIK